MPPYGAQQSFGSPAPLGDPSASAPEVKPAKSWYWVAGALGIADWLNRRGEARLEARWGAILLALQLAATAAIATAPHLLDGR